MSVPMTDIRDCGAYLPTTRLRCCLVEGHDGDHEAYERSTGAIHRWPDEFPRPTFSEQLDQAELALSHVDDEAAHHVLTHLLMALRELDPA